jgi:serine/threonine-protein phosphatase 2B regulatory subunit
MTSICSLIRFHSFYQLECTPFTEKVFSVMDIDHSGKINFNEYVISTWNYLSSDMDVLTAFAFSLFDIDDSKTLELEEIRQMVFKSSSFPV